MSGPLEQCVLLSIFLFVGMNLFFTWKLQLSRFYYFLLVLQKYNTIHMLHTAKTLSLSYFAIVNKYPSVLRNNWVKII